MKITLYLPDTTTAMGLFVNFKPDKESVTTTNWLTEAQDGKVLHLGMDGEMTEEESNDREN